MTKLSFGAHPFLLGFEQLERLVERTAKTASEGYPPFNIEATSENTYRITLAVAGFREEDLAITVEDRQLVVRGRQGEDLRPAKHSSRRGHQPGVSHSAQHRKDSASLQWRLDDHAQPVTAGAGVRAVCGGQPA